MKEQALILFIKNNNSAKSRIANVVGVEKARSIYNELIDECLNLCSSVVDFCDIIVYFSDSFEDDFWADIAKYRRLQIQGSLGEKINDAISTSLNEYEKAIIIGSDCPYITKEDILEGFKALDIVDVCIGPSIDGGYYLLGLKKNYPFLFDEIEWSTNQVFNSTIDKIYKNELSVATLTRYSDIDHLEDYNNWKANYDGKNK